MFEICIYHIWCAQCKYEHSQLGLQRGVKYPDTFQKSLEDYKKSWKVSKISRMFPKFTRTFLQPYSKYEVIIPLQKTQFIWFSFTISLWTFMKCQYFGRVDFQWVSLKISSFLFWRWIKIIWVWWWVMNVLMN